MSFWKLQPKAMSYLSQEQGYSEMHQAIYGELSVRNVFNDYGRREVTIDIKNWIYTLKDVASYKWLRDFTHKKQSSKGEGIVS